MSNDTVVVTEVSTQVVEVQTQGPQGIPGSSLTALSFNSTGTLTAVTPGGTYTATPTGLTLSGSLVASGNSSVGTTPTTYNRLAVLSGIGVTPNGTKGSMGELYANSIVTGWRANAYYDSGAATDKATAAGYSPEIQLRTDTGSVVFRRSTSVAADTAVSFSESMRIDAAGNVGINTAPSTLLHLKSPASTTLQLTMDTTTATNQNAINFSLAGVSKAYVGVAGTAGHIATGSAAGDMVIRTDGGAVKFTTNTGTSVAAQIDAGGNVGIGQAPSAWGAGINALQTKGGCLYSSVTGNVVIGQNFYSDGTNSKYLSNAEATFYAQSGGVHQFSYAAVGTTGGNITWSEAMRLDKLGNMLLGGATVAWPPAQGIAVLPSSSAGIALAHVSGTASGSGYLNFGYDGGSIGSVTQNGTTGVLFNTTSDARLKENIADAADAGTLVDAVQVRQYDWTADGTHQRYGFVAQELVNVFPEAVHQPADPNEMMAVDYSKLVPMLVKEIQSLRARVAALEAA